MEIAIVKWVQNEEYVNDFELVDQKYEDEVITSIGYVISDNKEEIVISRDRDNRRGCDIIPKKKCFGITITKEEAVLGKFALQQQSQKIGDFEFDDKTVYLL